MVPTDVRDALAPHMSRDFPWDGVNLHKGLPAEAPQVHLPHVLVVRKVSAVLARAHRGLHTAAATLGLEVWIDPKFYDVNTASGRALIAHEFHHVEQFKRDPSMLIRYEQLAEVAPPDRPWEHPLELPAYEKEREVYCKEVAMGTPKGRWEPLLVALWGC